jgi:recombination protein RecA
LSGAIKQSNTALIFTNQLREKIGVMFGNPVTTSGGRALKFYASVRLDIRRISAIKEKGEVIGNRTRVRVTKNKVAPPFRLAEFDIMYDEGISKAGDLLDMGVELGVIEKRGSYYYHEGENLAQGRENAKQFLREHGDLAAQVEGSLREHLAVEGAPLPTVDVEEGDDMPKGAPLPAAELEEGDDMPKGAPLPTGELEEGDDMPESAPEELPLDV